MARQAAREIVSQVRAIEKATSDNQVKEQQKAELASDALREYLLAQDEMKKLKENERNGVQDSKLPEKIQHEQQILGVSLAKACALAREGITVVQSPKAQGILQALGPLGLEDAEAVAIEDAIGDYLLGNKSDKIIITKTGEKSDFMKRIISLFKTNEIAAEKLISSLIVRCGDFGMDQKEMIEAISKNINIGSVKKDVYAGTGDQDSTPLAPEDGMNNIRFSENEQANREMIEAGLANDMGYYRSKFTENQLKLVEAFYSPTAFMEYMDELGKQDSEGKKDPRKVAAEKDAIRDIIRDYNRRHNKNLTPEKLEEELQKHWDEEVSNRMRDQVSELLNHLFAVLQLKSPHKFYDQVMQEADMLYGPVPTLNKIQTAINRLMTTTAELEEKDGSDDPLVKKLKATKYYRHHEKDSYIDERDGKKYPRIKPIAIGKKVSMSQFVENIGMLMDHTTHSDAYLYNSRAIYNHPAGEKGFYQQLGDFAEQLKGVDIDEILMLPDGQYVLQAYQLYDKYLKEDFASLDWRHRPDQFQQQIERVNSKLEEQMMAQFRAYYPELKANEMRVRKIINSAVGISRGLTLSEPETSAYADAVDADGHGMVASYSTNDAQSLNVFNSLHNALRWQGEHNWNLMYFMPVEGRRGMWKHNEAKENMAKYMDSFLEGHGRPDLPPLFVDILTDINKVGGPEGKRKGWRNDYSFDGHFVFKKKADGTTSNDIDAFKTFKAMEAIGYEAVASFVDTKKAKDLYKTESADRKDLFRYIFKRYIYQGKAENFQESDLDNYLAELRKTGEAKALDSIKKSGLPVIQNATWEEQITFATSQLFMESTLAHYTAARMPTLLLKLSRNRFTTDGKSPYEQAYRFMRDMGQLGNKDRETDNHMRELFDLTMKDFGFAETLFRRQISEMIREEMSFDENFSLDQTDESIPHRLNADTLKKLLAKNTKGATFKSAEEIKRVVELWEYMEHNFFEVKTGKDGSNLAFLDNKAFKELMDYRFTIGLEGTDLSLVAYRGTGPRMTARAIKDTASIEQTCTPWLMNMPTIMAEIATDGKHDFAPLIDYLLKAKKAINDVHGSEAAQEFVYKVSGGVINYFKKDAMAKPLFGLFRFGQINSNAAEYASSSNAVWEWESKEVDQFCIALRTYRLLPGNAYDLNKTELNTKTGKIEHVAGKLEDVWWINPITKKPFKTIFKKRHVDFEYNIARLRREHGADWSAIAWDYINKYVPLVLIGLLAKYLWDAIQEMTGQKK